VTLPTTPAAPLRDAASLPVPPDVGTAIARALDPDETVVWTGRPIAKQLLRRALPRTLFAVPWTAFAIFWMSQAMKASALFALWGVPFVVVGAGMLAAPWTAHRRARRTAYVLTDRRALVVESARSEQDLWPFGPLAVKSYDAERLHQLEVVAREDGSGDVIFERTATPGPRGARFVGATGFVAVDDVADVQRRVRALARGPGAG
jgi:hypothetical protein